MLFYKYIELDFQMLTYLWYRFISVKVWIQTLEKLIRL